MGKVQTVLGQIDTNDLGITLPHEHLVIDCRCLWTNPSDDSKKVYANHRVNMSILGVLRRSPTICKNNLFLDNIDLAVQEVKEFRKMGGRTVVDATSIGLRRNPRALKKISRRTKLNIIAGAGYYIAKSHPTSLKKKGAQEIADEIVRDVSVGIENSGVRAGVIGEIGVSSEMNSEEAKVLRGVAKAHLTTGCPIMVHLSPPGREGMKTLDVLEAEGVPLKDVALCHLDSELDLEYQVKLVERGCFISYDQFGNQYDDFDGLVFPRDVERVDSVLQLRDRGLLGSLLISQDIGQKIDLKHYGGVGYDHILRNIIPMLKSKGMSERETLTLLVDNPKRFLAFPG